jgi:hypothetical protein
MDKDVILRQLFDLMVMTYYSADKPGSGASKVLAHGAEYYVCPGCAMQCEPYSADVDTMKENVLYPYDEEEKVPVFTVTDLNRLRPEVALESESLKLKDAHLEYCSDHYCLLPVNKPPFGKQGFWLLEKDDDLKAFRYIRTIPFGATKLMRNVHMVAYTLPVLIGDHLKSIGLKLADLNGSISCSRLANIAALVLHGDVALFWMALMAVPVSFPGYQRIIVENDIYVCDGLEDIDIVTSRGTRTFSRYKSIKKKGKVDMDKLGNPYPEKKSALAASMPKASALVSAASPNDKEITEAVQTAPEGMPSGTLLPATPQTEPTAEVPAATHGDTCTVEEYQKMEATVAPATEAHVVPKYTYVGGPDKTEVHDANEAPAGAPEQPEEKEQPAEKPKAKRRTKSATAAGGFDLESVIEYLGSPVQDVGVGDIETVLAEIRSLRDIQITAARRSANLTSKICTVSADGLKTLAALQEVLNNKK